MIFVKTFTRPEFEAKKFTHLKYVNFDYFHKKGKGVNALASVIFVAFWLEFN